MHSLYIVSKGVGRKFSGGFQYLVDPRCGGLGVALPVADREGLVFAITMFCF